MQHSTSTMYCHGKYEGIDFQGESNGEAEAVLMVFPYDNSYNIVLYTYSLLIRYQLIIYRSANEIKMVDKYWNTAN